MVQKLHFSYAIDHVHLEQGGQIWQKMEGLKLVNPIIDWVMFLDDDLLLDKQALLIASELINEQKSPEFLGIGLSLPYLKQSKFPKLNRFGQKFFGLHGDKMGTVLKNGHATSYLEAKDRIYTEWLNGASIWRKDVLHLYNSDYPHLRYAAYEDVAFSYQVAKKGLLVFEPKCKAFFQESPQAKGTDTEAFKVAGYVRANFVAGNKELSMFLNFWAQIGRSFYILINTSGGLLVKIKVLQLCTVVLFNLAVSLVFYDRLCTLMQRLEQRQ
jgi:glycosyltransferase involved in cell wall biosynthesis